MIVVSLSLPFSDYTEIEQLEEYAHIAGIDDNLQLPPLFNIPTDSMIPNDVYQEIEARLEVLDISESAENIMREFIVPILIGSIRLLGPFCEIKIKSDHYIAGSRGYGRVDFDI
mmetsp:Transcript_4471/g.6312  ORF Transcript_4471/g.6312 Transcript_4471/m.6312 type:complete len:114 (+) Transcript_4471:334-675(+)